MKTHILRLRQTDKQIFDEIRDCFKTVETRAATDKYRKFVKGDTLVFVCGKARLEKKINKVAIFPTIGAVLKAVPRKKLMPSKASDAEVRKTYYSYPGYREKIAKHGIIAFYI